jgi:hypothetical protein
MNLSSQPTSGLDLSSGLMNEPPLSPGPAPDPPSAPASPSVSLEAQVVRLGLMTTAEVATTMQEQAETGRPFAELAIESGRIAADDVARLAGSEAPAPPAAPDLQLAPPPAPTLNVVQPLVRPPAVAEPKAEVEPEPPAPAAVAPEPIPKITLDPEPAPTPVSTPTPAVATASTKATVFIRLTSGERISAGQFDSVEAAEGRARELMLAVDTPGNWPRVDGRYIKPDTVVSIDVEG